MASLTLKNLPKELLDALREAAGADRRSVTQEIIHLLELALRSRRERRDAEDSDVESQIAAWRKIAGKWVSDTDFTAETETLMKHRTRGRKVAL